MHHQQHQQEQPRPEGSCLIYPQTAHPSILQRSAALSATPSTVSPNQGYHTPHYIAGSTQQRASERWEEIMVMGYQPSTSPKRPSMASTVSCSSSHDEGDIERGRQSKGRYSFLSMPTYGNSGDLPKPLPSMSMPGHGAMDKDEIIQTGRSKRICWILAVLLVMSVIVASGALIRDRRETNEFGNTRAESESADYNVVDLDFDPFETTTGENGDGSDVQEHHS